MSLATIKENWLLFNAIKNNFTHNFPQEIIKSNDEHKVNGCYNMYKL